jgi:hypothetical protein
VRASNNAKFHFDTAAGWYLVLCFYGSARLEKSRAAPARMTARSDFFDDERAAFRGSIEPGDKAQARVMRVIPGPTISGISSARSAGSTCPLEGPDADKGAKCNPFQPDRGTL